MPCTLYLALRFLQIAIGEWHREPGLLAVVLRERRLVPVGGREDDLEVLTSGLELLVDLAEDRGELAARRAPAGTKRGASAVVRRSETMCSGAARVPSDVDTMRG